jgi:hypothetical protein
MAGSEDTMTSTNLAHYNQFTAALAKAASVDEVKQIHDKASALKAAAKVLNDRDTVANMAVVRAKAERVLGQKMETEKSGRAGRGKPKNISGKCLLPTLKELGISDNLAHRARRAAAMPQEKFDALIAEQREEIRESTTTNQIYYPESEAEVAEAKVERKKDRARAKQHKKQWAERIAAEAPELGPPLEPYKPDPTKDALIAVGAAIDNAEYLKTALAPGILTKKLIAEIVRCAELWNDLQNLAERGNGSAVQTDDERRAEMAALDQ